MKKMKRLKKDFRDEVKSSFGIKKYKIQEVIKPGQVVLIQVIKKKEVRKGCSYNFYLSSRKIYSFNAEHSKGGGISRKIFNSQIDKKLEIF